MARLVLLDAGPLGLASNQPGKPQVARCLAWIAKLRSAGVRVIVPEIADYEVRRELVRVRASGGLRRLDDLGRRLEYQPITTAIMLLAADHWAAARRRGQPTGDPRELDADAILAATAILTAGPGEVVTVATDNVGHLAQYVHARPWTAIT